MQFRVRPSTFPAAESGPMFDLARNKIRRHILDL